MVSWLGLSKIYTSISSSNFKRFPCVGPHFICLPSHASAHQHCAFRQGSSTTKLACSKDGSEHPTCPPGNPCWPQPSTGSLPLPRDTASGFNSASSYIVFLVPPKIPDSHQLRLRKLTWALAFSVSSPSEWLSGRSHVLSQSHTQAVRRTAYAYHTGLPTPCGTSNCGPQFTWLPV